MATLTLKQLSKRYDRDFVFADIDLQLEQKEFLVIVGEDGSGKTTLMKLLAGLETPSLGEIYLDDEPVYRGAPTQSELAVVFEKSALYQDMTVYQNIAYVLRLKKCPKKEMKERVEQAMELMSITGLSGMKPKKLTEEQSQRVMLARAIAKKPKLLLLDEPFRGFGREAQMEIHQCLISLYQKMDTTFIYATRMSSEVNRMATQILHLEEYHPAVETMKEDYSMKELKPMKEGKVREIYDNDDSLIMVATDRISCFDVILKNEVTKKGTVLTQMSKFWFDMTEDILPNHMISVDVQDMPEFFRQEKFDGNSMLCRKLEMLPIECIVRGYITGSGWASYQENGTVCGIKLPEGLRESDKLPEPIYTPSTKAEIGDHDENISYEQSVEHLEKYFPGKGEEYAAKLRDYTIALYKKCAEYALGKGIIIADTKFEFGLDEDGNIVLGDEMLTPDSSRFWPADGYEPGHGQPSFDKQFARDWLKENEGHDWTLPQDIVQKTIDKYLQGYELLTGEKL